MSRMATKRYSVRVSGWRRPAVVGIMLAALLCLLGPGVASAHAHLVQADPAPGSVIGRMPAVASFLFDEPLNPALTRVRLITASGQPVRTGSGYLAPGHDGELWRLPLPHLPAGTYSVLWTSESATDGHVMSSFYTFQVSPAGGTAGLGTVTAAAAGAMSQDGAGMLLSISTSAGVTAFFAWLGEMAQALWLGALIVELAVLARARRSSIAAEAQLARAATRRVWALGAGAIVATIASLIGETLCLAVQGTGGDWGQALAPATLGGVFSSQNGQLIIARLLLLLGAWLISRRVAIPGAVTSGAVLPWSRQSAPRRAQAVGIVAPAMVAPQWESVRFVVLALAGLYMLLVALSGHAANVDPVWLSSSVDWVHLVCTGAWVGGMAALAYGVIPFRHTLAPQERAPALLPLLDRFSPVAYVAVGALALSGLFTAVAHLHTVSAVTGTTYGHLLTLKSLLVGLLIVLSASHVRHTRPLIARAQQRLGLHPRFPAAVHEGLATLAARLRLEVGIGALVLLATALMGQTLPATSVSASTTALRSAVSTSATAPRSATPVPVSITGQGSAGDLRVALTVAPPAVGMATFTLHIWEQGRPITENTGAVLLHLYPAAATTLRANLAPAGHGTVFSGRGSLAMAGLWRADVLVRTATVDTYRTVPLAFMAGPGARFMPATPHLKPHAASQTPAMSGMAGM